ncbi:MAG: UDP-2,3-diacylglucosamine hydrolase [Helicobacteraceae bacterium CG2_30_36_10]|nr:MAG: UDP-2,3-diacylglucosamine hydrolase [Helicobacteraceae bacterium CG2_30_36_10]
MQYKSIFISDVHLGTKFSQAEKLLEFLKDNESEHLYLVGDIIDGWAIKRKFKWSQSSSDVIQKILRKARKGTEIVYITGNHDEFLRPFLPILLGERLTIANDFVHIGINGKKYFVTHGDFFDSITMSKKWLTYLGDVGYDLLLHLNKTINRARRIVGVGKYWSLSKYVKDNIKKSVSFITGFEDILTAHARNKGYDGIICGHIHKAENKMIEEIQYLNCGDWVENCSAVVETMEGQWKIIELQPNQY